jgi:hypothetical protein
MNRGRKAQRVLGTRQASGRTKGRLCNGRDLEIRRSVDLCETRIGHPDGTEVSVWEGAIEHGLS